MTKTITSFGRKYYLAQSIFLVVAGITSLVLTGAVAGPLLVINIFMAGLGTLGIFGWFIEFGD
jgi:hypothetical protein